MAQPKKKRRRVLPRDITERPDDEVMERIFGRRVKRELDRIAGKEKVSETVSNSAIKES